MESENRLAIQSAALSPEEGDLHIQKYEMYFPM